MSVSGNFNITQPMAKKLAHMLSERIITGEYAAGARLTEKVIAKEFGVSHGPVREALQFLANAGLVTIRPYRGAEVTELSVQEVQEIFQVRATLVGLRARWIAESAERAAFIARTEPIIEKHAALANDPGSHEDYLDVAFELNCTFTEWINNRWLRETLDALTLQTARYTRLGLHTAERKHESAMAWKNLIIAIREGNSENAERIAYQISIASRDAAIRALKAQAVTEVAPVRFDIN